MDEQDAAYTAREARAKLAFKEQLWLNTFNTVLAARLAKGERPFDAIDIAKVAAHEALNVAGLGHI